MNKWTLIAAAAAVICAGAAFCGAYFPFWKKRRALLPVLRFGKIGKPFSSSKLKKEWISPKELEKRLDWLKKLGFTPVSPEDVLAAAQGVKLPPRPVLLVFEYGLQSFYKTVFPQLAARGVKACVCLCAEHVGQYNAWQNPETEPWQNTLTEEQLAELKKSKLVSFASHGLSYRDLNRLEPRQAAGLAAESLNRLKNRQKLSINAFFYPASHPSKETNDGVLRAGYAVTLSRKKGVNAFPPDLKEPLYTLDAGRMGLWRLRAKITRG